LHDGQYQVAQDKHRFRIICAGRRWGKSTLAQLITLRWAVDKPGIYWIVSPTYKQAKMIHWREMKKLIPAKWIAKTNETELSFILKNGSIIELKGAENPDTLRGTKLKGLVIDEIASIRNWDWLWAEVLRATLTDYEAPAIFISTPKGYNHFYELFQLGQKKDKQYKSWRFTSYENPYIPAKEINQAKQELTEDTFAQEYLADFRKFTGLVYKEFVREIHVIEPFEIPDDWRIYRGIDFGSTNPTACVWIAVDHDENFFIVSEHYEAGQTIDYHAGRINSNQFSQRVEQTFADPSGAQWMAEFAQRGVYITPARKETGQDTRGWVRIGIEKIREMLRVKPGHKVPILGEKYSKVEGAPRFFVFNTCENTIKEFETYRWKEKATTQAQDLNEPDLPEKANDHCFVGNTKVLTASGNKAIKDIRVGDLVITRQGFMSVKKVWDNGIQRVGKYRLQFGAKEIIIEATPDHLVKTTKEWKPISKLKSGEEVYLFNDLMGKNIISTQGRGISQKAPRSYIGLCGNIFSARSRKVILSTIKTMTRGTIISRILNLLKTKSIVAYMDRGGSKRTPSGLRSFKKKASLQPRNGIGLRRVLSGIGNTLLKRGRKRRRHNLFVKCVEKNTGHPFPVEANIATRIVKLKHFECVGSSKKRVYDLTVQGAHEFFANGILVHNCMDATRYVVVSYGGGLGKRKDYLSYVQKVQTQDQDLGL